MNATLCGCGLGCPICMPGTSRADSPSLHPKPAAGVDIDESQVTVLFSGLSDYGKAMVWALLKAAARLDGKAAVRR